MISLTSTFTVTHAPHEPADQCLHVVDLCGIKVVI